jgi:hypothetical protein
MKLSSIVWPAQRVENLASANDCFNTAANMLEELFTSIVAGAPLDATVTKTRTEPVARAIHATRIRALEYSGIVISSTQVRSARGRFGVCAHSGESAAAKSTSEYLRAIIILLNLRSIPRIFLNLFTLVSATFRTGSPRAAPFADIFEPRNSRALPLESRIGQPSAF